MKLNALFSSDKLFEVNDEKLHSGTVINMRGFIKVYRLNSTSSIHSIEYISLLWQIFDGSIFKKKKT